MVKNAVRIINLNVFKVNDPILNENIIGDVPFCLTFVHLACDLRDKVIKGIDQSYNSQNYLSNIEHYKQLH